jgi:hypothetical protein
MISYPIYMATHKRRFTTIDCFPAPATRHQMNFSRPTTRLVSLAVPLAGNVSVSGSQMLAATGKEAVTPKDVAVD